MNWLARGWSDPKRRARGLEWLAWFVLLCAFLCRAWVVFHAVPVARIFHDSKLYFSASENAVFSRGIWAGDRSPLPLLFFKWCQADAGKVRSYSWLLSVLAWPALAVAVASSTSSAAARILGPLLVLWLASSREIVLWNDTVLSESLSFSCAALCLACAICFLKKPKVWFAPLILTAVLFGLCRDSNAYLILFCGLLWLTAAVYRGARRKPYQLSAVVGLAFVAIFGASNASTNQGGRWQYPLTNVVVWRVLPDAARSEQFAALGMPTKGLRPGRPRRSYDTDNRLQPFRDWLEVNGKHAYVRYLVANPRYLLGAPVLEVASLLGESLGNYDPKGIDAAWPWQYDVPWLRSGWWLRLTALPILCGVLLLSAWRRRVSLSPLAVTGLVLTLLLYPHALVVWHGDAMEVVRHGLPVASQAELALLCLLLAALESRLTRRSVISA